MPDRERYDVHLDVGAGRARTPATPQRDDPFLLLVVGDFRGRAASGRTSEALSGRRPVAVDRDDIDEVLARFAPSVKIERSDGVAVELTFREMEDFHPDAIFRRAPFFRALRDARQRAREPRGNDGLLGALFGEDTAPAPRREAVGDTPDPRHAADEVVRDIIDGGGGMLDRIVAGESGTATPHGDPLRTFLQGVVAPHIVQGRDPAREAVLAELDAATVALLRDILHAPEFRALERLWRGVEFLVRRIATSPSLKILLLDATRDELREDMDNGDAIGRILSDTSLSAAGPAAIVVDLTFEPDHADLALLHALARTIEQSGAILLASASPRLAGLADGFATMPDARSVRQWDDEGWHAFRRSTEAASTGLALPRFLLRLPYGEDGEPCDALAFEETDGPPAHEDYLWGNPAFACAVLLAAEFDASGWSMRPGIHRDIAGLPLHSYSDAGGPALKPCAECTMSDELAEALMEAGFMVLASVKHGDTARLVRFQSVATPLKALRGPWSRAG